MNLIYETPKEFFDEYEKANADEKSLILNEIEIHRMSWLKNAINDLNQNAVIPQDIDLNDLLKVFEALKNEYELNQIKQLVGV